MKAVKESAVKNVEKVRAEIHKVIIGQDEVVDQFLWALFAGGHALIIGVPGLAKTLLIRTISRVLDLSFNRVQFTPDLMPSDIVGTEILDEARGGGRSFRFVKGPVFANVVLGDEINRSPPKTQSALLQAMQEKAVTVSGKTYPLDLPFFVLATQNPIEQEGTYPLPEAQLDRFMFSVHIGYPTFEEEKRIVSSSAGDESKVKTVLSKQEILDLQHAVEAVPVSDFMVEYILRIVRATRPAETHLKYVKDWVEWGAGPRASQCLVQAARARCLLAGRNAVSREDIETTAFPVLRHRLVTNFNAESERVSADDIVRRLLQDVRNEAGQRK
jgi:MoxR-like ATPase